MKDLINFKPDVIIIGAGLAGLVCCHELTKQNKKVLLLDQETEANIGGQAFWSLGGLFFINSPEQRLLGIKDSLSLAKRDWMGTASFDREEDHWPKKWANAYLEFAEKEKYKYVTDLGISFLKIVGWAERGSGQADKAGNSVPRFHVAWGTGTGIVKPFVESAYQAEKKGLLSFGFRHQITQLITSNGDITGVAGNILKPDNKERGQKTNRTIIDQFQFNCKNVVIASGGIGGNHDLMKKLWPVERFGNFPKKMVAGVPDYVDGHLLEYAEEAGAHWINKDRMWNYTEGVVNYDPIWSNHGIRILPGPSSIWLDAKGNRFGVESLPGFNTLSSMKAIKATGYDYSWFILNETIIKKEFALSGSEQNPEITDRTFGKLVLRLLKNTMPKMVGKFIQQGEDFVVASNLDDLVEGMNSLTSEKQLDVNHIYQQIIARDQALENSYGKDIQVNYIANSKKYIGDKLMRIAKPHKILDKKYGPLIAVKLNLLSRKSLGGIHTNLNGQVLKPSGQVFNGLYAVGEASGFGGGGMHGYGALEGTFLGGCIFTGLQTGKYLAIQA